MGKAIARRKRSKPAHARARTLMQKRMARLNRTDTAFLTGLTELRRLSPTLTNAARLIAIMTICGDSILPGFAK